MNQEKKEMDMCEGPLAGKILRYTLPLALSGILQLCFNAADMIVVGRYASGEALAAVGSTGALINLIINVFMGLAVGVSVCVAHAWGAKNKESVRQIVHTAMLTSVIAGMIVLLIGFFGCRTFLSWMGTPDNVIALSTTYMKIYFLGMPACMVYNFGASVL
ncbi:MAG: MATE family efflux transporter, partial [Clostridia bacterium]|nr:MATE family efflux transporter [Clostridia bacterium]